MTCVSTLSPSATLGSLSGRQLGELTGELQRAGGCRITRPRSLGGELCVLQKLDRSPVALSCDCTVQDALRVGLVLGTEPAPQIPGVMPMRREGK